MFVKTHGATLLGVDGWIVDVEVNVPPWVKDFELLDSPDMLVKDLKLNDCGVCV